MALTPFGWQRSFINYGLKPPGQDYLLMRVVGGRGACKTFAEIARAVKYALLYEKSRGVFIVTIEDNITSAMLPIFHTVCSQMGMEYGTHWTYHAEAKFISFINGSTVMFRSAERPGNVRSHSFAWFCLDEWWDMPEEIFHTLLPALRQAGYPHQAWLASTPASKSHWCRKYFLPHKYAREFDEPVHDLSTKGWHLLSFKATTEEASRYTELSGISPIGYQGMLIALGGPDSLMARQQLFGEEVLMEGLRYPTWNPDYHMKLPEVWGGAPKRILAGVDFGGSLASTAVVVEGVDETGLRYYLMDEWGKRCCEEQELVRVCYKLKSQHGIEYFICDSADPRWIRALQAAGLPALSSGKKDRGYGMLACMAALNATVNGEQGFFADPKMKQWRNEIENYVIDDDKPKKQRDDFMDAWRMVQTAIAQYLAARNVQAPPVLHFNFSIGFRK